MADHTSIRGRKIATALLSATCALAHGSSASAAPATNPSSDLLNLMEPGSVIKDLLIPQYDQNRLATAILRAKKITVLTNTLIEAENTSMHLIRHKVTANIGTTFVKIDHCSYDTHTHLLDSQSPLRATSSRLDVQSQGLISTLAPQQKNQQIFLRPPVLGILNPDAPPTESSTASPISSMKTPRLLASALLATLPATAQEKPNIPIPTPPDLSVMTMTPRNEEAEKQLLEFAQKHNIPLQAVAPPPLPPTALLPVDPAQQIPQFKPTADAISFVAKGGVFFNSATSTITFLDNITMRDPSYAMTVTGKIIATFIPEEKEKIKDPKKATEKDQKSPTPPDKTPPDKKIKKEEKKDPMGRLKTIDGTGGVAFEATDKENIKNYAFGDTINYEQATGIATLTGNRLIFQKGDTSRFESMNPNAWLKYNRQTKDFAMSEGWKAIIANPSPTPPKKADP